MNILFFPYNAYSAYKGGIARITCTLIDTFREHGHTVIKLGHKKNENSVVEDELQFYLPNNTVVNCTENMDYVVALCKKHAINVVIFQNPVSSMMSFVSELRKKISVKIVSCLHNSVLTPVYNYAYVKEYELKNNNKSWLYKLLKTTLCKKIMVHSYIAKYRKLYREIVNESDAVVVLCEGQAQELSRMCGLNNINNVYVIPNCMNTPPMIAEKKEKLILWVGVLENSIKRPDLMLDIWDKFYNQHQDWNLAILGSGPASEELKKISALRGLKNIQFTGRVNPQDYYKNGSILCVTSTHEAFPMVILEAMFNGVVPVAFDSFTSARVLIEDANSGRLVKPFNTKSYADTLSALVEDNQCMKKMAVNAKRKAEGFTTDEVYKKWFKLFNELIRKNA